ncbi:putative membrane protein [Escherichia coli 2-316-03_S1_C1]|nr:putative membrane protein [Escherichia coli 2-316-03_S1_C1]
MKYYENNVFSLKNNAIENFLVVVKCFMLLFLCAFYAS